MSETLVTVGPPEPEVPAAPSADELDVARELVRQARAKAIALTGQDGLLKALTKTVLQAALDEEMSDHLGYDKHAVQGRNGGNSRNRRRSKTGDGESAKFWFAVLTELRKGVICSTNAIESLNARYRRAVRARGHFPTEQAAMKTCTWSPDPWTPKAPDRHDGSPGGSRP